MLGFQPSANLSSVISHGEFELIKDEIFSLKVSIKAIFLAGESRSSKADLGLSRFYSSEKVANFRLSKGSSKRSVLLCVWGILNALKDLSNASSNISMATDIATLLIYQIDSFVALIESSSVVNAPALVLEMLLLFAKLGSTLFFLADVLQLSCIESFAFKFFKTLLLRLSPIWLKGNQKWTGNYLHHSYVSIFKSLDKIFWGLSIGIVLLLNLDFQELLQIWLERSLKTDMWRPSNYLAKEIDFQEIGISSPLECIYLWLSIAPKMFMNTLLSSSIWENRFKQAVLLNDEIAIKYTLEDVIWNPFIYVSISWSLAISKQQHSYWTDGGGSYFLQHLYALFAKLDGNNGSKFSLCWQLLLANSLKLISIVGAFPNDLFFWFFEIHAHRIRKRETNCLEFEMEDSQFLSLLRIHFSNIDLAAQPHSLITKMLLLLPRSKFTGLDTDLSEKKAVFWLNVINLLGRKCIFSQKDGNGLSDSIVYSIHHSFCRLFLPCKTEFCFQVLADLSQSSSLDAGCIKQFFDCQNASRRSLFINTALEQLVYFYEQLKAMPLVSSKEQITHAFFKPSEKCAEQTLLRSKYCRFFYVFFDALCRWEFPTLSLVLSNLDVFMGVIELLFKCDKKSYLMAIKGVGTLFTRVLSFFPDYVCWEPMELPFDLSKQAPFVAIAMKLFCESRSSISVSFFCIYFRKLAPRSATLSRTDSVKAL